MADVYTKFQSENLKGRDRMEDLGVDGKIILKRSYGNKVGRCGLDICALGYIHTYIPWILKFVMATIVRGINHKDPKCTGTCNNNKTKTTQTQYDEKTIVFKIL
jgi:hypothetical protein